MASAALGHPVHFGVFTPSRLYPGYDAPAADLTRFSTALAALLPDL